MWNGNVPLHEWNAGREWKDGAWKNYELDLKTWLFEEESFVPLALLQGGRVYSIVTDQLGTPTEAYNAEGEEVWRRRLDMNGKILEEVYDRNVPYSDRIRIPFLFQEQYCDYETGLAYNRFRYYDPELGRYISEDPIRFNSGTTALHSYVEDTHGWVDVLGLKSYKQFTSRKEAFRAAKRHAGISMTQHPDKIKDPYTGQLRQYRRVKMTDRNGSAILNDNGKPIWTKEYQYTRNDGSKVIIQDHSAGHKFLDGMGDQGPHFNIRPIENTRTGKLPGTLEHYNY